MSYTYECKSSYPASNAQLNLAGKTHYVDSDTLRFHKSRILETHITDNGLLFALIESCAADMDNTKRIFRPVIFDLLGNVISRPTLENSFNTRKQANKALWGAISAIDAKKATLEAIERAKRNHIYEMEQLTNLVA
jgi:hypothetical protein